MSSLVLAAAVLAGASSSGALSSGPSQQRRLIPNLRLGAEHVVVTVPQPDPPPSDPGRCLALSFGQFKRIPGVEQYTLTVRNVVLGQDQTFAGAAFDDDVTVAWATSKAPRGFHRYLLGWASTGEGCDEAEAMALAKFDRVRLSGSIRCTTARANVRVLRGSDDDDVLCPDGDTQVVRGGSGGDVIVLPYSDLLRKAFGGRGNDTTLAPSTAAAMISGGPGNDAAMLYANGEFVSYAGGTGTDTLFTAAHEAAHVVQQRGVERVLDLAGRPHP